MWPSFTPNSKYRHKARFAAILWTLLILFLCFLPAKEIPDVHVPLADKWTHFILFGVFALLWLMAAPSGNPGRLLLIFFVSVLLGWLVEELQGVLSFLGRSKDNADILADAIGGALGTMIFYIFHRMAVRSRL